MRRFCIACVVLAMAVVIGCGKKQEEQKPAPQPEQSAAMAYMFDPVDGEPVDIDRAENTWVYKDVEYYFNSEKNMKEFQKDPEKYIAKIRR